MRRYRGDTLVEVLLATVVLSIIIAGSYALTSRATRLGQGAIERTEASKRVEEQAEALRAMQATESLEWVKEFVPNDPEVVNSGARVTSTLPSYDVCEPTGSKPFFVDLGAINSGSDLHDDIVKDLPPLTGDYAAANDAKDDIFAVWVEAYSGSPPSSREYIDFHVRACWNGLGSDVVNRAGSILRLSL